MAIKVSGITVIDNSRNASVGVLTATSLDGTLSGSNVSGDISGNAASATALQTARTIGGVSFDGTANINLPGVNAAGNQNTSGNASTATKLQTARTIGGVSFDGTANINLPGVNTAGNQNTSGTASNITSYTVNQSVGTGNNVRFNSFGVGTNASGTAGEIRATNNITAYYSDDRLKTRFENIPDALEKVCSLNGFYYEANETAQELGYKVKREVGVSAQEVQSILPEIVTTAPIDDKYLTVYYDRLVPLLIEAIKEQQEQINILKSKYEG